jgi:hypothetical protein
MKKVVMMLMIGLASKGALQAQERSAVKEDIPSMHGLVSESRIWGRIFTFDIDRPHASSVFSRSGPSGIS